MASIESVADTAFWVATYRADEGKRPDALFSDPLAERLVEGRGREITRAMTNDAMTAWTVVVRTRIIDDFVTKAVADGFDTVLNLGAGLDTRPYRMDLPASLRWIEVDFASTIDFKEERLAGERARCELERRRVDLSRAEDRRALLAEVDAKGRRILVLTEGVVPYLTNDAVSELAADLHRCAHVERWVLEYMGGAGPSVRKLVMRRRRTQLEHAPFLFEPKDWRALFAAQGWQPADLRYVAVEGQRLGRMAPLPWWLMFILRRLPKSLRERSRKNYGYAVLERR
jgi:methyltransferase (TIGR00027 family)